MIDPEVKLIHSPDALGLEYSGNPLSFALLLEINIGPRGDDASDVFSIMAVSADQFEQFGPGPRLVLPEWDKELAVSLVTAMVAQAGRSGSAEEIVKKLRRWFAWEYENHVYNEEAG